MKRSEINASIEHAKARLHAAGVRLPPFAYWTPTDWRTKGPECDEIRECRLGWDVTDFGSDAFDRIGLVVFTVRNGHRTLERYRRTTYCEKILVVREDQRTPAHYHALKQEDIVCRSGGDLVCQVWRRSDSDGLADADVDVTISLDGVASRVPSGQTFILQPGESIRLPPFVYHEFYARRGTGPSIVGEISTINDDTSDNFFLDRQPRFPAIDEDVAPVHLLCTEY